MVLVPALICSNNEVRAGLAASKGVRVVTNQKQRMERQRDERPWPRHGPTGVRPAFGQGNSAPGRLKHWTFQPAQNSRDLRSVPTPMTGERRDAPVVERLCDSVQGRYASRLNRFKHRSKLCSSLVCAHTVSFAGGALSRLNDTVVLHDLKCPLGLWRPKPVSLHISTSARPL
jgi:hypothetical protein